MIVNQMGGGSGGEVWKHYLYEKSYAYDTSQEIKNIFYVDGNLPMCHISGCVSFEGAGGNSVATGYFSSELSALDDLYTRQIDIRSDRANSSGSWAASCGRCTVDFLEDYLKVTIKSYANKYAFGGASKVTVTVDVFYQEG